jgi:uncharacterized protein YjiS (DUF1127 family)
MYLLDIFQNYFDKQIRYARTIYELNSLLDLELSDLGMKRWEIESIARQTAFEAKI